MATTRKPQSLVRHLPSRSPRLIIIAAENKYAEKQYFEEILEGYTRAIIKVLPTEDSKSSPQHVIDRLHDFISQYQEEGASFGVSDEFWLMVDVDRWHKLEEVAKKAIESGYKLAISKPCFEVWLLCHYDDAFQNNISYCGHIEDLLSKKLGVNYKKCLRPSDIPYFRDNIEAAIKRSIQLDINPQHLWPQQTGTHVYKVVQSIMNLKYSKS
ncbi:MAG: hypothetical protein DM484_24215 [Candidatus Methylumidiphilus alinenensis]|uniref:RloB domain-containing protein n=1 Tax=Candidatus Methylumidiphilus alinenensis TaxID=2202197 RepID=A0A2W4QQX5_9GAMM|nr:MAG: hypothetical protein DM484_24215 [Candidatus Methylumidiphilus alinenensis]